MGHLNEQVMLIGLPHEQRKAVERGLLKKSYLLSMLACSLLMLEFCLFLVIYYNVSAVCTGVLIWPAFAVGLFFMVAFIMGCEALRKDDKRNYVSAVAAAIPILLAFLIFGYVAVGGVDFNDVEVREYSLTDYGGWLRGRVPDPQYWATISGCIRDKRACDRMRQLVQDPSTGIFVPEQSLATGKAPTPIESGCCKPPSSCAFTYVNGTTWIPTPGAPTVETNVDCTRWSNDQQTLCFQCDSCKAGLLDELKKGWKFPSVTMVLMAIALMASFPYHAEAMGVDMQEWFHSV